MKPAIFNTNMVRAILDGRKTQTRRILKCMDKEPYQKGDIIYVRETWADIDPKNGEKIDHIYKADSPFEYGHIDSKNWFFSEEVKWKPSIHMPKEYARLFLRVKDVRIERLNEISEEDAISEGIDYHNIGDVKYFRDYIDNCVYGGKPILSFGSLWESIYGDGSFNDDYVWVIEFDAANKIVEDLGL